MISQLFILAPNGHTIVHKDYRGEVPKEASETFLRMMVEPLSRTRTPTPAPAPSPTRTLALPSTLALARALPLTRSSRRAARPCSSWTA